MTKIKKIDKYNHNFIFTVLSCTGDPSKIQKSKIVEWFRKLIHTIW